MVFNKSFLGKRGQLSVEFILIVLVVLVLIETIILPLRDYSESSVKDIIAVSYLEEDISKIQSAINNLSAYSEGKLTVNLHVPEDSNFVLYKYNSQGDVNANYSFKYSSTDMNYSNCSEVYNNCQSPKYVGKVLLSPSDEFVFNNGEGFALFGPLDAALTITKQNNIITISK